LIILRTVSFRRRLIVMANSHLKLVSSTTENRTVVTPLRRPNAELRTREYLTDAEVARLQEAAKANRWGHRDATMILVVYRHGFRASELVDLRWNQIDFEAATLAVRRVKKGSPATHPIRGDELRALRRLQREQDPKSPFVFTSERASPFTTAGFARMVERAGEAAELGFKAHPHMLRHATGFPLANNIRAMIRGPCRPISATKTSSTPCATPSWRRIGSRTSGGNSARARPAGHQALAEKKPRDEDNRDAAAQN
jgi:type 1 fimbriae regulatory protein FimB/type 1 fimbriae regulatory protein FimE